MSDCAEAMGDHGATNRSEVEEESDAVVRFAVDQRQPQGDDEPHCVVCGRYGAYICDATDEDVCSMECRDVCITQHEEEQLVKHEHDKQRLIAAKLLRKRLEIRVDHGDTRSGGGSGSANKETAPFPIVDFSDCELPPQLYANMQTKMYEKPTPVQMQVIPCALARKHLLVVAPTGTGKTAAYLIPVLAQIINAQSLDERHGHQRSPKVALLLAPIRELAIQIEEVTKLLVQGIPMMKTALLVGGFPVPPQLYRLQTGVQVIIATPGRFIDVFTNYDVDTSSGHDVRLDRHAVQPSVLSSVICCVVDEVDMMLDIGFHSQIVQIMGLLPPVSELQMLFCSATVSSLVEALVNQILNASPRNHDRLSDFFRIEVGGKKRDDSESSAATSSTYTVNPNIRQKVVWVDDKSKKKELFDFLKGKRNETTLVFVKSKIGANMLADAVEKQSRIPSASIHADKSQSERLKALEAFVNEDIHVLVSTNVLSRGMDLLQVQNVVVFDFPNKVLDYIHLIGRTGRGNEGSGHALVMVNTDDKAAFPEFVGILRAAKVAVPREVYQSLHKDAQKTAFRSSAAVIDESKRAFRIQGQLSDELGKSIEEWREWSEHAKKKLRLA